jgi:hypothetical protein
MSTYVYSTTMSTCVGNCCLPSKTAETRERIMSVPRCHPGLGLEFDATERLGGLIPEYRIAACASGAAQK